MGKTVDRAQRRSVGGAGPPRIGKHRASDAGEQGTCEWLIVPAPHDDFLPWSGKVRDTPMPFGRPGDLRTTGAQPLEAKVSERRSWVSSGQGLFGAASRIGRCGRGRPCLCQFCYSSGCSGGHCNALFRGGPCGDKALLCGPTGCWPSGTDHSNRRALLQRAHFGPPE